MRIPPAVALRLVLALAGAGLLAHFLPPTGGADGWSLFPPLAAILGAVATGRLVLGLSLAIVSGAWLSLPGEISPYLMPFQALRRAALDFVWTPLRDSFQIFILGFTAALIGMVRVVSLAGGTKGIARLLVARAAGARSARLATAFMGVCIFFDDYANTLVVGATMRPITDRFRVSREKLAYLVDSTAAPVAGIAVVSTWIGYEVGLLEDAMRQVGGPISGYELFFRALPGRFYCLLTLSFLLLSILLNRDFGPMLRAERRALSTGQVIAPQDRPMTGEDGRVPEHPGLPGHWALAASPVGVVLLGVLLGMHLDAWNAPEAVQARQQHSFLSRLYWTTAFAKADSAKVMFLAALAGSALAFALALTRRDQESGRRPFGLWQVFRTWVSGITGFSYALLILILAWAIKETCQAVGTSTYLVAALSGFLDPRFLPLLVFLLSGLVSFSIGTSWTTMAILLPTMVPVAFEMGGLPLCVLVAAAVLDGAIFGDHCSPISDTTVLSSIASSCDHLAHVRTQMPYALATMSAAALCGYLGTTLLYSAYLGLLLGTGLLLALLLVVGRCPESQ